MNSADGDHIYIFGYGSLVNEKSRARTLGATTALAARVRGFQRAWCARGCTLHMTTLGIRPSLDSSCNGVLVKVAQNSLPELDKRELGYERVRIPAAAISADAPLNHAVYTYVVEEPQHPEPSHPIAQTYLDVALSGFLALGLAHAEEFLETTHGWHGPHVDDRAAPRYHAGECGHPLEILDALLKRALAGKDAS